MPELACDLMDIGMAASGCAERFSGLGNFIFVAYPEDLTTPPEYDESEAAFTPASIVFAPGKGAWKFRIKKKTGKISATGNEGAKGYNVTLAFSIDRDVENAAKVLRILKNRGDAIFFAQRPEGGYYVVYDPTFGTDINNNYDTGDGPDSESGHTATVTCNPCRFPITKWDGTLTLKSGVTAP